MGNEKNNLINKNIEEITSMVKNGDVNAINELAYRYFYGEGVEENKEEAFRLYMSGAEQGSIKCKFNLAMCYYNGNGTEKNKKISFEMFKELAENHNHFRSYYYLGEIYFWGDLGKIDYEKAFFYYSEALKINPEYLKAKFCIAYSYYSGKGIKQNYKTAFEMFSELVSKYDFKDAYFYLGELYYLGRIGQKDYEKAHLCFNKSIEYKKNTYASKYYLGEMFLLGNGVEPDCLKAKMYFEEILDENHNDAYYKLALIYTGEYGFEKNDKKAKEYFEKIEFDLLIALIYYILALKPEEEQNINEILKLLESEMEMEIVKESLKQFPINHPSKTYFDRLSYLSKEENSNIIERVKNKINICKENNDLHDAIISLSSDEDVAKLTNYIVKHSQLLEKNKNIIHLTIKNGNYLASELIEIKGDNNRLICNYKKIQEMIADNIKEENISYEISQEDKEKIYKLIKKIDFNEKVSNNDYLEGGSAGEITVEFDDGTMLSKEFGSYMPSEIVDLYQFIISR